MKWGWILALFLVPTLVPRPDIVILNPQSYPCVGGLWEVRFNTTGKADLRITPAEGTEWEKDLEFLGVYCGSRKMKHEWDGNTIVVRNYECSEGGKEVSRVLNRGKHHLEFDFGGKTVKAHNSASFLIMEWGVVPNVGEEWVQVNLTYEYVSPVIVASPQYEDAGVPTVTRIANVTFTSFEVKLQNPGDGSTPTTRNVHYIVVEEGNWTLPDGRRIEAQRYISTQTDYNDSWTPVQQSYLNIYASPVVQGQVMSHNDSRWSVFWASASSRANPPSATEFYTGKHVAEDPDRSRMDELVGFIVAEQGHGTLNGVEYDFFLSSDVVEGVTDSPPFYVTSSSPFSTVPSVGVISSAAMDDANGGWPALYGTSPFNTTGAFLVYDEDQLLDTDRSHTSEQVATFLFSTSGSYINNSAPVISNPQFNVSRVDNGEHVRLNVTVTDDEGANVTAVNATFRYPNGTLLNASMVSIGYPTWEVNWTDTFIPGRYNVTDIYAWDGYVMSHSSYSDVSFLSVDTEPPKWSQNSTNDTTAGQPVEHRVHWTDNVGLSGYVFSFDNCTGTLVNDSWVPLSGTSAWVNVTRVVNSTPHCTIRWRVYVNDSWDGLWNMFSSSYETELKADLAVNQVVVNNTGPKEGEWVLIQANVSNSGPSEANFSSIWFNSTDSNGVTRALGEVVVNLSAGGWVWVNLTAQFGQGTHEVNVSARTAGDVVGLNPNNDWNTTNLTVPIWAYFHGNVTGELVLATSNTTLIFEWNPSTMKGNFFLVDYDADVDFLNLKALNGTDDLHELDVALGTENCTDSVKNTYDADGDGRADNTSSFNVYGVTITDVPVVNVTSGSPWLVGILWDGDDGSEYTGAEDVVFVVELKASTRGAFGVNDYEARAPSNLKQLTGNLNLIATRVEIR